MLLVIFLIFEPCLNWIIPSLVLNPSSTKIVIKQKRKPFLSSAAVGQRPFLTTEYIQPVPVSNSTTLRKKVLYDTIFATF